MGFGVQLAPLPWRRGPQSRYWDVAVAKVRVRRNSPTWRVNFFLAPEHRATDKLHRFCPTGVAKTNGTTAAAKVRAAIPARAFNGMNAMIFLRRLWKISRRLWKISRLSLV